MCDLDVFVLCFFSCSISFSTLILLVGSTLMTCKNRLPYNLYCVGGDVKHCTIQSDKRATYLCSHSLPVQ